MCDLLIRLNRIKKFADGYQEKLGQLAENKT